MSLPELFRVVVRGAGGVVGALTHRHLVRRQIGVHPGTQLADALGWGGLDLRIRFGQRRALAGLAAQCPTSDPQLTGWDEVPAFPKAVAPKSDRRLRAIHDNVGMRGTLPFTSVGAGAGSFKKPCRSSSGSGNTIVLFFSAAISVSVCR